MKKLPMPGPASCYPASVTAHIGTRQKDDHSSEPFVGIWAIRILLLNFHEQPLKLKQNQKKTPLLSHVIPMRKQLVPHGHPYMDCVWQCQHTQIK